MEVEVTSMELGVRVRVRVGVRVGVRLHRWKLP